MGSRFSEDVRRLVACLGSVRQLDVLLQMCAGGSARTWTPSELNRVLRSSETAIEQDLSGLLECGLVETVEGPPTAWRYAPGANGRAVDDLAAAYRTHRTTIIGMIANPRPKSTVDDFADAFRLRKDRRSDG